MINPKQLDADICEARRLEYAEEHGEHKLVEHKPVPTCKESYDDTKNIETK